MLKKVKCIGNGNGKEKGTKNNDGAQCKDDWIVIPSRSSDDNYVMNEGK